MTQENRARKRTKTMLAYIGIAASVLAVPMVAGIVAAPAAMAQSAKLPKPYVSRAIDATLMEITPQVRSTFGIKPNVNGVLVVSTDPRGVAAQNKIVPGDIITDVRGRRVKKPIDVDTYVLYWLKKGDSAFQLGGNRGGAPYKSAAQITLELFEAVVDLATISSWSAYSSSSFSYTEYYEVYSTTIVEEYSYSETLIEETVTSSSFESEITSEESYEETSEESSEEVTEESSEESSEESEESTEEESEEEEAEEDEAEEEEADEPEAEDEPEEEESSDEPEDEGSDESGALAL